MRVCVRASLLNVCQKIKRYLSLWANAIRMIFWCVLIHIIFVLIILIIVKNIRHKKVNFSESLKNESIHKLRYYQRRRSKSLSKLYNLQTNNTKNVHLMHSVQFFFQLLLRRLFEYKGHFVCGNNRDSLNYGDWNVSKAKKTSIKNEDARPAKNTIILAVAVAVDHPICN